MVDVSRHSITALVDRHVVTIHATRLLASIRVRVLESGSMNFTRNRLASTKASNVITEQQSSLDPLTTWSSKRLASMLRRLFGFADNFKCFTCVEDVGSIHVWTNEYTFENNWLTFISVISIFIFIRLKQQSPKLCDVIVAFFYLPTYP